MLYNVIYVAQSFTSDADAVTQVLQSIKDSRLLPDVYFDRLAELRAKFAPAPATAPADTAAGAQTRRRVPWLAQRQWHSLPTELCPR